jgi:hypothetical protein
VNETKLVFRKSSYSNGQGDCVEVADLATGRAVRDSKVAQGPVIRMSEGGWADFISGVSEGQFGH